MNRFDFEKHPPTLRQVTDLMSTVPRWGGQTIIPFSVLQHSLVAGRLAQGAGEGKEVHILHAYLHDVEEGLIGADIGRPYKTPEQAAFEKQVREVVFRALKAPMPTDAHLNFVKQVDDFTALAESEILIRPRERWRVHAQHEGDTPEMETLEEATECVWEVMQLTRAEAKTAFIAEVEALLETRQVKSLAGRL